MALRTHFRDVNAGDLCNSLHAHMKSIVSSSKADLEAYQAPSFSKFLHKVKDFFMGSTITKDKEKLAVLKTKPPKTINQISLRALDLAAVFLADFLLEAA